MGSPRHTLPTDSGLGFVTCEAPCQPYPHSKEPGSLLELEAREVGAHCQGHPARKGEDLQPAPQAPRLAWGCSYPPLCRDEALGLWQSSSSPNPKGWVSSPLHLRPPRKLLKGLCCLSKVPSSDGRMYSSISLKNSVLKQGYTVGAQ